MGKALGLGTQSCAVSLPPPASSRQSWERLVRVLDPCGFQSWEVRLLDLRLGQLLHQVAFYPITQPSAQTPKSHQGPGKEGQEIASPVGAILA